MTDLQLAVESLLRGVRKAELADVQNFCGWGRICCSCQHVFDDHEKYIRYSPEFPCHNSNQANLRAWDDGTESCPAFERRVF